MSDIFQEYLVEQKVADIWDHFLRDFFVEFGGLEECTMITRNGERRTCNNPTNTMKQKRSHSIVLHTNHMHRRDCSDLVGLHGMLWQILNLENRYY